MDTPGDVVRLLLRLGYWSMWHGLYREAATLFRGARAARPASEVPVLGMAVLALLMQKPESAVSLLEETALALNPTSDLVRAHLGVAHRLAGNEDEGLSLLQTVAAQTRDLDAKSMAESLLHLPVEHLRPHLAHVL